MKKVYLELTNRCNLNCMMCYRKSWHEETKDMDEALLEKCINEIVETDSIEEVVLGGIGEPVYSKQINWVIKQLKNKRIIITTNGTIMTDELIALYTKYVDEIVISIDGMSENFYKIRNFPLEKIMNNIERLNQKKEEINSKKPQLAFQMVISKENANECPDLIDFAHKMKASKVIFSNIVPATKEDTSLAMYSMYEKEPLQSILKKANHKAFPKGIEVVKPEVMLKTERRCRFIDEEAIMVRVDGKVVPCYRFAHDGKEVVFGREKEIKVHFFGDVARNSLGDIWNSDDYYNYREMVRNNHYPSCMDCDLVDGCDMVTSTEIDCYGNEPSCADCLWARRIVYCV